MKIFGEKGLSESEIRSFAKDWLEGRFNFQMRTAPRQVTLSLPIPASVMEQARGVAVLPASETRQLIEKVTEPLKQEANLPVPASEQTTSVALSESISKALGISDPVLRADSITALAILTASWNPESAAALIRGSIKQSFPRAKALLHLATSLEAMGNKEKAEELLREIESILSDSDRRISLFSQQYPEATFKFFLVDEILALKKKLGLTVRQGIGQLEGNPVRVKATDEEPSYFNLIETGVRTVNESLLEQANQAFRRENKKEELHPETQLEFQAQLGLAYFRLGNLSKAHQILKKVANSEIGWVTAKGIVKASLALAIIGHPAEAIESIEKVKSLRNVPNRVGVTEDYLFIVSGKIKLIAGDVQGAREDFLYAANWNSQHRRPEDDYGVLELFEAMTERAELLNEVTQITDNIRNHEKRANALVVLALKNYNLNRIGETEKLLSAAERIAENIEDEARHELMKFRISTIRARIRVGDKIEGAFDSLSQKRESDFPAWFSADSAMLGKVSSRVGNPNIQDGILHNTIKLDEEMGDKASAFPKIPPDSKEDGGEGSASSPSVTPTDKKGGIDFRALPIVNQQINMGMLKLNAADLNRLNNINLGSEWAEIQNMVNAGIIPSNERIKEYMLASCFKQGLNNQMDKVLGCIADIMRMEEDRVSDTDAELKDMLVLIEAGKPESELQLGLSQIKISPQEPQLITP